MSAPIDVENSGLAGGTVPSTPEDGTAGGERTDVGEVVGSGPDVVGLDGVGAVGATDDGDVDGGGVFGRVGTDTETDPPPGCSRWEWEPVPPRSAGVRASTMIAAASRSGATMRRSGEVDSAAARRVGPSSCVITLSARAESRCRRR